jgi:hypothetical protein
LPVIGSPLIINGRSQPEFVDSWIELNGITGGCSCRRAADYGRRQRGSGLAINKFGQTNGADGIQIEVGGNNIIEGNFIGVDGQDRH